MRRHDRPTTAVRRLRLGVAVIGVALLALGCGARGSAPDGDEGAGDGGVLADTTFLADIAQNVAGDRLQIASILPLGSDPHSFEPTPRDAKRVAESRSVIINCTGLVPRLDDLIAGLGASAPLVIEAASGLSGVADDPHVWLDPVQVITYVDNIADGLGAVDPAGADAYRSNADAYSAALRDLDVWIVARVETIPAERRLLVTNHESLGYFAARYGFRVVGAVFPSVAGEGSPSAQQVSALIEEIRTSQAPAIFLETGSNAALARQVAKETGIQVVTDLYTASLGEEAATYVDMMRWNVDLIVEALR